MFKKKKRRKTKGIIDYYMKILSDLIGQFFGGLIKLSCVVLMCFMVMYFALNLKFDYDGSRAITVASNEGKSIIEKTLSTGKKVYDLAKLLK